MAAGGGAVRPTRSSPVADGGGGREAAGGGSSSEGSNEGAAKRAAYTKPSPVADGGGGREAVGGGSSLKRAYHKSLIPTAQAKARARELRRTTTPPERLLWRHLRASKLVGLRFRRQHPVGPFVVDLCCVEIGLILEIDGLGHRDRQKSADDARDAWMNARRLTVLRIPAAEVRTNLEGVVRTIEREAAKLVDRR